MKLLVCVKQIPDPDAPVRINADSRWVDIDGDAYVMNRFDAFALEEALLTLQSGINQPRYPSLSKMLRANKYPLDVIPSESLESPSIHLSAMQTTVPQKTRAGLILEGTPREKASQLLDILQTR